MKRKDLNQLAEAYRRQHLHDDGLDQATRDAIDINRLEHQESATAHGRVAKMKLLRWLRDTISNGE